MGKKEDEEYEDGVRDGQRGDLLGDTMQGAFGSKNTPYGKGYDYGAEHRRDSDGKPFHTWDGEGTNDYSEDDGFCYLTTACTKAMGLPDDCFELRVLRGFRDNFLKTHPVRKAAVEEYYELAPKIVRAIEARSDAKEIWEAAYEHIKHAVSLVLSGDLNGAFKYYTQTTLDLQEQFLS